ncbi:hypothetical protein COB57_01705 [Candidatus Peregrinibacteria bacterium]|nr:MAG: hypothetical protein COB57_01705 [Candidatus Peregrinibacteria bacterium]
MSDSLFCINPTNEYHLLRHFNVVDSNYTDTLIGQSFFYYDYEQQNFLSSVISKDDILFAQQTLGTKFFNNIEGIENPQKLLEIIQKQFLEKLQRKEIAWENIGENQVVTFTFAYRYSVGKQNVRGLKSLSQKEKKNVQQVFRSHCLGEKNILIKMLPGQNTPETDIIYVEINRTKNLSFYFITAFPFSDTGEDGDEIVFF